MTSGVTLLNRRMILSPTPRYRAFLVDLKKVKRPFVRVKGGVNLVYFPQSLSARSRVDLLGEGDLNRWIKNK